jgi:hypothetical protein
MNQLGLHLLGSILLAIVLLGVAELVGRSEAHAASGLETNASGSVQEMPAPQPRKVMVSFAEQCLALSGIQRLALEPKIETTDRPIVVKDRPLGWSFLAARLSAG